MKQIQVFAAVALVSFAIPVQSLWALHAMEPAVSEAGRDSSITIRAQFGVLNGEAREIVYSGEDLPEDPDYKVSDLIWDLSNVAMAGGVVSIGGGGDFVLNAGLWIGINEGIDGEMYDYDWLDPSIAAWTDVSRSEVDVVDAMMFDVNLSYVFSDTDLSRWALSFGFMYDLWEWDDRGQEFLYSINGFRDTAGSFEGMNVIDYKQWFFIPYIGIEGSADFGGISLQGYVLFSPFVVAEDEDYHVLREIHFRETFEGGTYYAFGGSATWDLGEAFFIQASLDYQSVEEIIGDMEIVELSFANEDGAGISHKATTVSAAVGIRL